MTEAKHRHLPVGEGEHVVAQGETISSIALKYGHFWQTLWDDPANAELKEARRDPEVLLPGDRVAIPPLRKKEISCATGKRHVFRRKGVPVQIKFTLKDSQGEPLAGKRYSLVLGDRVCECKTGADGGVEHWVLPSVREGVLQVWAGPDDEPYRWELQIGHLDPAETTTGAQARLKNLGWFEGEVDGRPGPGLEAALRRFQESAGLEPTGQLDGPTQDALRHLHGSG